MTDVDRRTVVHSAGLRRLSNRSASRSAISSGARASSRSGLQSYFPLAEAIISHLRASGVSILPGLSDSEFAQIEAKLDFSFPPDLRAVLSLGLPSGPAFPDWRSRSHLRAFIDLPIAAVSFQIARGTFWPRSWGQRPSDHEHDLPSVRSSLRRAPLLIPLFDRCYIPCRPSLAGNPIFFIDENRILCCGFDLPDFFRRDSNFRSPDRFLRRQKSASAASQKPQLSHPLPHCTRRSLDSIAGKAPRWIEFWSEAVSKHRRRNSLSSSNPPIPNMSADIRPPRLPEWVGSYLNQIGSVLKEGGWGESDVNEMIEPSSSISTEWSCAGIADDSAVLNSLLLKADRCSDSLRRAGWSSEELSDAFCFDFHLNRPPTQKLSPKISPKFAVAVSRF
ncbi:hypothetical protein KSP39_PZI003102 [Platanthera zijinensis]|uniref:Knr4/Smi1-like domain-containing protein n=1 Tax=Platanthera zijinensis TaxID=2320716 RepID=A0AAP0BW36_9ASPA